MTYGSPHSEVRASIIVPAHDEQDAITNLLTALLAEAELGEFEVVVVCNGCTDRTAEAARAFGNDITVLELPEPSKRAALKKGDEVATRFPRIYIDADVQIDTHSIRKLIRPLAKSTLLATGPRREFSNVGVTTAVRWYYGVWQRLPQVRTGLFGRGVIAFSESGHTRIAKLPSVMSDDLAISEAFADGERCVVSESIVQIWPPKTLRDLIRRRIRTFTGNAQIDALNLRGQSTRTTPRSLIGLIKAEPYLLPKVLVFCIVTTIAKLAARKRIRAHNYDDWLRDHSSRQR